MRLASDLSAAEQQCVRVALKFLRVRFRGWSSLSKALRVKDTTLSKIASGGTVTTSIAVRTARLVRVGIDDLLVGKWPPAGSCPLCGSGDASGCPEATVVHANGSA
jgi:hypothetical protein